MRNLWKCILPALIVLFILLPPVSSVAQENTATKRINELMQAEKYAEARVLLEEELEGDSLLNPNKKANYLFMLAFALDDLKEFRASINTWHRMIAIVPDHPLIWGNLGWAYYQEGDVDSAIIVTKKSLALTDDMAFVWANMGLYMLFKGDIESMQDAYQKAAKCAPDAETWETIRSDLETLCAASPREGCAEAEKTLQDGWMSCLQRWYEESDTETGLELVHAHAEDFARLHELLTARIDGLDGAEREKTIALQKRLAKDVQ